MELPILIERTTFSVSSTLKFLFTYRHCDYLEQGPINWNLFKWTTFSASKNNNHGDSILISKNQVKLSEKTHPIYMQIMKIRVKRTQLAYSDWDPLSKLCVLKFGLVLVLLSIYVIHFSCFFGTTLT
jgi:hypothetical protein